MVTSNHVHLLEKDTAEGGYCSQHAVSDFKTGELCAATVRVKLGNDSWGGKCVMHSTTEFTHNGKIYEIRIVCDGESVYVKAFCENRPANPFRYSATIEAIQDMSQVIGLDAVKHLIETARQDVVSGLH